MADGRKTVRRNTRVKSIGGLGKRDLRDSVHEDLLVKEPLCRNLSDEKEHNLRINLGECFQTAALAWHPGDRGSR